MATLTAKQQRALSQAPKRDRARLQQLFQNQNNDGSRSRRSGGRSGGPSRSQGTRLLAQGAGALPSKPFGPGRNVSSSSKALTLGLNARLPYHLGLPRPVAAYQVIRTSKVHTTQSPVVILTPFMRKHSSTDGSPQWFQSCGIEAVNATLAINGSDNARMIDMPMSSLGPVADVVPAAMTVQVMCPTALQTATGIFTMARVPQQLNLGGETRTWAELKDQFDGFFKPRLLTAGKLALRGVTTNAIPIDMSEFSEFAPSLPGPPAPFSWTTIQSPAALSPIMITHDHSDQASRLTLLITMEWRVRFDPANPAAASHTYHPSTPDSVWNDVMKAASNMGHGVEDIADSVADVGAAVGSM